MADDETSLFAQEVAGIKPLDKSEVYLAKKGRWWTLKSARKRR
ncbi:hypothetical protein [Marinomonas sp. GJ51-6]|nr:hypothetical protein [Marinomonas sp. GJ51-6]WOD08724.1 hypothetical protein ONZ50_06525 [Marinomonas sp. GJ51-6]